MATATSRSHTQPKGEEKRYTIVSSDSHVVEPMSVWTDRVDRKYLGQAPQLVKHLAFGTDYPHIEGTFPNSQAKLAEMLEGLSDEEQAKIAGGNLARIYGIG